MMCGGFITGGNKIQEICISRKAYDDSRSFGRSVPILRAFPMVANDNDNWYWMEKIIICIEKWLNDPDGIIWWEMKIR